MCFSAEASFITAAVLVPVGGYCIQAALRKRWSYVALAAAPLFFGIQQIFEGFVWLGIERHDPAMIQWTSLGFLFFALGFWPFWIPLSAFFVEEIFWRKCWIGTMTLLSLVWMFGLYGPIFLDPERWLTTQVVHYSIYYNYFDLPIYQMTSPTVLRLLYLATIVVPYASTSNREVVGLGILLIVSAVLSHFVFAHAFVSVWCFFAAVLAGYLGYVFYKLEPRSA